MKNRRCRGLEDPDIHHPALMLSSATFSAEVLFEVPLYHGPRLDIEMGLVGLQDSCSKSVAMSAALQHRRPVWRATAVARQTDYCEYHAIHLPSNGRSIISYRKMLRFGQIFTSQTLSWTTGTNITCTHGSPSTSDLGLLLFFCIHVRYTVCKHPIFGRLANAKSQQLTRQRHTDWACTYDHRRYMSLPNVMRM